tara:strand:- start:80574 stop:81731 length:1158 start_codon:yes stop_codon:yes gene_type:complete
MTVAALLLAGGRGMRAGGTIPKQYREIGGKTILRRAVEIFLASPLIDIVQVVIHQNDEDLYQKAVSGLALPEPVFGGIERHSSTLNGLESLISLSPTKVLIHDVARPFVDNDLIERIVNATLKGQGAIPALAVVDSLKRVDARGFIEASVDRTALWRAQTPQGFFYSDILHAHQKREKENPTDDAVLFEKAGGRVIIVDGNEQNIKLTTPGDFERASLMLQLKEKIVHVGNGFDVHRFGPGNHVMLCGIKVPHSQSLVGHSDADVALHALTDAILGAIGAGDIGQHFSPDDNRWNGAPSSIFVEEAARNVVDAGGLIYNVDITIIGEFPKVNPYREEMRKSVASMLGILPRRVNIKATTTEKLGFTGRQEGLAAQATASIGLLAE